MTSQPTDTLIPPVGAPAEDAPPSKKFTFGMIGAAAACALACAAPFIAGSSIIALAGGVFAGGRGFFAVALVAAVAWVVVRNVRKRRRAAAGTTLEACAVDGETQGSACGGGSCGC